jgi:hypothetical protein
LGKREKNSSKAFFGLQDQADQASMRRKRLLICKKVDSRGDWAKGDQPLKRLLGPQKAKSKDAETVAQPLPGLRWGEILERALLAFEKALQKYRQ